VIPVSSIQISMKDSITLKWEFLLMFKFRDRYTNSNFTRSFCLDHLQSRNIVRKLRKYQEN